MPKTPSCWQIALELNDQALATKGVSWIQINALD